ncbi:hypothetical protein QUV83_04550 [Cellulomonas cellasea]|uniref:hypothetical protein n=1 Tax=Cellulomonas cellasea TaxID=43670 RepID=UPI0025A358D3|nr:hypothetical protein [Cellulomonas cellasea]MDM8084032.1 hypothetical protein [Cellulomonas cellasea]
MTEHTLTPTRTAPDRQPRFGMPLVAMAGLALLGLPRVILHDLHVIDEGTLLTALLAIGPVLVWIAVTVLRHSPRPFLTVLLTGVMFGVMLVITHQLLWDTAFEGAPPAIGTGEASTLIPRLAAIPSGLVTGTAIGAIGGLVAWGATAVRRRAPGTG